MALFICCEIVSAYPMSEMDYIKTILKSEQFLEGYKSEKTGYLIHYSDNQNTWIEKSAFDFFFRKLSESEINLVKNEQ